MLWYGNMKEFRLFLIGWIKWLWFRAYRVFASFEKVKKLLAQVLYRQRGRFARPFVHTAMGAVVAMGVVLAPVLASTFPGVQSVQGSDEVSGTSIMAVADQPAGTLASERGRDKILDYKVEPGDTLSAIAKKFGISIDTLRWENNLASVNSIKPGQILKILPVTGVRHKVTRGETVYSIAKKYGANSQAIVDFQLFNTFEDDETFALAVGQELIVPDGEKPNVVLWSPSQYIARKTPDAGAVSATGQFVWPIGGVITQRFSWYHTGVDIAAPMGTPVLAADSGKVIVAGWPDSSGYGNRVEIDHGNGFVTLYAHLSKVYVGVGQTVKRGDQVGAEGSTGRSTGPHLHFEVRKNGVRLDGLAYLK